MKIAIAGPEATGRTSLAEALAARLSLPLLEDPRLPLLARTGYQTIFEWDAATLGWPALVREQAARERTVDSGIIDAGVMDLFCGVQRWVWNRLSPETVEQLRTVVAGAVTSYTHIIVMPAVMVAPAAAHRFRSQPHTLQIDRLLQALVNELALTTKTRRASGSSALAAATALESWLSGS
jgi:hypothetical protein